MAGARIKMRIASLLPSSTEILCQLGFEADLVARSHECDYPATVAQLPAITAPKFNPDGNQYFNRPGPRLAGILHPDRFNFGHAGTGWQRL